MSTSANIYVGEEQFYVTYDGYPEGVIPVLKEIVQEAREVSKKTGRGLLRELIMLLNDDEWIAPGFVRYPSYEYEIGPRGGVYLLRNGKKTYPRIRGEL